MRAQLDSLENQTRYYDGLIRSKLDWEFAGIFCDAGISGAKENRPGFMAMMEQASQGEIDLILTKSLSRFARNTLMMLKSIRQLKEIGVAVEFEKEGINTLRAEGELLLSILASIAEEERKQVSTNLKWSFRNKFKRGEAIISTTNRLLGYEKDSNGNLIVCEEQARIARYIFKLYNSGLSSTKVAERLNAEHVPTYTKGEKWNSSQISRMIRNEKFMGDCLLQKGLVQEDGRYVRNTGQLPKYMVKNHHDGIISRKNWQKAQSVIKANSIPVYPWTSMLKCPHCGKSLTRTTQAKKQKVYWVCGTRLEYGKDRCIGVRIPEAKLPETVFDQPMIVEVRRDEKAKYKKSYHFTPATGYFRS
jgi:DNA invertase Pin-like site-specific DNA recombinase/predicted RNA-binding Zn-ribbon protein involved in translation (DUF1610 family)